MKLSKPGVNPEPTSTTRPIPPSPPPSPYNGSVDKIQLINWLNREIAELEAKAAEYDPLSCSRMDEADEAQIHGMIWAYESVKRHIK